MTDGCLLGVDLGTSSVKAVAVDLDGHLLARSSVEHPMHHPRPGWAENDPEDWYAGVVGAVRRLLAEDAVPADAILGLSVVSQRDPMVLLGAGMKPLTPAISWTDRRTEGEVLELNELFGREWLIDRTGVVPIAGLTLPILRWTQRHLPDVWRRTRSLLFAKDYVLHRLTGARQTDISMPARSVMYDVRRDDWCDEICSRAGIDLELLPPVAGRPWERLEELGAHAASELGLRPGIPLAVGGADDCAAALGAGAVGTGDLCAGTGTSSDWRMVVDGCRPDADAARGDLARHVVDDRFVFSVCIESTGSSLRWFRDAFPPPGATGVETYPDLIASAASVPAGADGLSFYPFVDGGRRAPWYVDGATGAFLGIVSGHTRAHFVRAILEGIAFQYPPTLELIKPPGPFSGSLAVVDGESRNPLFNQLKADVLGLPIRTLEVAESAALGSALLAAQAAGVVPDAPSAVERLVHFDRVYEPDPDATARYRELRAAHEQGLDALRRTFRRHEGHPPATPEV
jgi:xylulokinase